MVVGSFWPEENNLRWEAEGPIWSGNIHRLYCFEAACPSFYQDEVATCHPHLLKPKRLGNFVFAECVIMEQLGAMWVVWNFFTCGSRWHFPNVTSKVGSSMSNESINCLLTVTPSENCLSVWLVVRSFWVYGPPFSCSGLRMMLSGLPQMTLIVDKRPERQRGALTHVS